MANLKEIKRRIGSVKKTRQITSAMKLVAGAKLRKATEAATRAKPYQEHLAEVLGRVAAAADDLDEPLLKTPESVSRVLLVVLSTDRGLCGAFNNLLLRRTRDWVEAKQADGIEVDCIVYGRKASDFFKYKKLESIDQVLNYAKSPKMELVRDLTARMRVGFTTGEYDEVWFISNVFVNTLVQTPTFARVLPLTLDADSGADEGGQYEFEPEAETIVSRLLPLMLRTVVLQKFLETDAGEQAARMTAMDNATRNASDLIDSLTLQYNRARQAAITTEITEIVSGAEALAG